MGGNRARSGKDPERSKKNMGNQSDSQADLRSTTEGITVGKKGGQVTSARSHEHGGSVRGDEKGAVIKRERGLIKVGLVYPNTYYAGMSNLGFQSVYGLFNSDKNVSCCRFFLPDRSDIKNPLTEIRSSRVKPRAKKITDREMRDGGELRSCETGEPLSSCDIIAFSVSFENDYLNIVSILRNSAIPQRASDRSLTHPLIIAGGVACFLNPEPVAPFIDCLLLGESEEMIPAFLDIYSPETPRQELKRQLAIKLKGAYVPEFYEPSYDICGHFSGITPLYGDIPSRIKVQHIKNLSTISTTTLVLTSDTAFNNIFLIETGRGCHHGCRFCSAGFIYRPSRFYPDRDIIRAMGEAKELTDKIGLVSAAVSDHPALNQICAIGIADELQISFSSLRLDALTEETVNTLVKSSVKTATIAPEAGSQRMRNVINKKISENQILSAVECLVSHGIMNLKLYFMVGLPFETDEDIRQIVELTAKIKEAFLEASRKNGKMGTITLSINPFIPKPTTPFQWCAMDTPSSFKKKVATIREGLKKVPNLTINTESPKTAMINALLSRGDRRMADLLETASEKGWPAAIRSLQPLTGQESMMCRTPEEIVCRELELSAPLPWDILDTGIKKEFLIKEFERAEEEKISADCPMVQCSQCGICREES